MSDEASLTPDELSVEWHDIRDPDDPLLDQLAARYHLHPLHIEDCRHRDQRAKVEEIEEYIFIVLKPVDLTVDGELNVSDLDIFLGRDFVITVQESACPPVRRMLDTVRSSWGSWTRGDQLVYRISDGVVDCYLPALDRFGEIIDELEDTVLHDPSPAALQRIFETKRALIQMRRVLINTRDVAGHLQRTGNELVSEDLWPFLRDVYDHVTRNLELVETQRDLINGCLDIYLSSIGNRTNRVMKALAVMSTVALPALIVTGIYGMNIDGLPFAHTPYAPLALAGIITGAMLLVLLVLHRLKWF